MKSRRVWPVAAAAATILACGCTSKEAVSPEQNPTIEALSAVSLQGTVDGVLTPSVVVRDSHGNPVSGLPIQWRVETGGGSVVDSVTQSDDQGRASATWLLPAHQGTYTAVARVDPIDSLSFYAVVAPDSVPPVLLGLERRDSAVQVGDTAVHVRFTVMAADSGSGVYWTVVRLSPPGGSGGAMCSNLSADTAHSIERTVPCDLAIPAHAKPGPWHVSLLVLQDRMRNETQLTGAQLASRGYPVTVQVSSATSDLLPPRILSLSMKPDSVALDTADATVVFSARLVDDGVSGVKQAQLAVDALNPDLFVECLNMSLVSGSVQDGIWSCPVTFPKGGRPGTWNVARFTAWDATGNSKTWMTSNLQQAGLHTGITVTDAHADTVPPVLLSLSVQPDSVHLVDAAATVEVSIGAADDGLGIAYVEALIGGPSDNGSVGKRMTVPAEGNVANGVYRCTLTIPAAGVAGTWALEHVILADSAGNTRDLSPQDLVDAGFDPYVKVTR